MAEKGKRIFTYPEWGTAYRAFADLAKKKPYAERFRLEYYFSLVMNRPFGQKLKLFFFNWLSYFSQLYYLLKFNTFSRRSIPEGKFVFLFLSDNASYYRAVLPVAEELFNQKTPTIILCPAKQLDLVRRNLPNHMHSSLYAMEMCPVKHGLASRINNAIRGTFLSVWETLWFLFQPLKGTFLLSPYYARYALGYFMTGHDWKRRFNNEKAWFMAANDFWYWESILTLAARGTQCRTAVIQHGMLADHHYPFFADKFLLWGQHEMDTMVDEYGASEENTLVIGSPVLDKAWNRIQNENLVVAFEKRDTVCFLTQPFVKSRQAVLPYYKEAIMWFCRFAEKDAQSGLKYVLKLHPSDDPAYYDFLPANVSLVTDDLLPLLGRSRAMVNIDSTAVLEAALTGTPGIQTFPGGHKDFIDHSQEGLTILVESETGFIEVMDKLTRDPEAFRTATQRSSKAVEYYFSNLGHSASAIAELAGKWIKSE